MSSLTWSALSRLMDLGLCSSQQYTIYHIYDIKLQVSQTIHRVQKQPNLGWVNISKDHINPSLNTWISFEGFHSRLLQPWIQNIYVSNFPNSLYTILHIRDTTLYPYCIVHFHWPKSVENVLLGLKSAECINVVIFIVTNILIVWSTAPFWCKATAPLNLIFCCFFNRSSVNSEVLNILFSVWYTLIATPWLLSSLFNKTIYRVWRPSRELESKNSLIRSKHQYLQIEQQYTIYYHSNLR